MVTLLLRLLRLLPLLCGAHRHVALENLALRHQLAVYKKTVTRPKVRRSDRLFWVALARVWAGWRQALVIVSPNTVLHWQRRRFCEHWTKLSARPIAAAHPSMLRSRLSSHGWLRPAGRPLLASRSLARSRAKPPSPRWAAIDALAGDCVLLRFLCAGSTFPRRQVGSP